MEALVGVVVGVVGSLVVGWLLDRRARAYAAREARLEAAREVLGALQELNRRLIDLARVDTSEHHHTQWPELHAAVIRWNSAQLAAALVATAEQVDLLRSIDLECDRVMDQALARIWVSRDFRTERAGLGELGARYLNMVRVNERLPSIPMSTIWSWADLTDRFNASPAADQ